MKTSKLLLGCLLVLGSFTSRAALITMTNADASGVTSATSTFTSKGQWNTNVAPTTGNIYLIPNSYNSTTPNARTPADGNSYAFGGDQLILSGPGNTSAAGGRLIAKSTAAATYWLTNSAIGLVLTNYGMIQQAATTAASTFVGGVLVTNGGALLIGNGPLIFAGALSGNGPLWVGTPSGPSPYGVTFMGSISNFTGSFIATNFTSSVTFSNGLTQTFSGNLTLLNNAVTVQGAGGVLTLAGNNKYVGLTTISSGTTLILSGNNTAVTTSNAINGTLQLQANAGNTVSGTNYALGTLAPAFNRLNNGGTLQLRSGSAVLFNGGNSLGGLGSATVTIDVNQLTGGGANNVLSFAPAGFNTGTSTINVTGGNGYSLALGPLNSVSGPLTLNPTTANASVAGITGNLTTLTKNGTGTLTLTAASTYAGGTVINTGTLALGSSATLASTNILVSTNGTLDVSGLGSALTLASGQVLRGYGTVNGSVDGASGLIFPGVDSGAGTLTISTNLTLSGGGAISFDLANNTNIGGTNDLIIVGGNLAITGPTTFNLKFLNGSPATGTYTLLQCASISTDLSQVTLPANPRYSFSVTTNLSGTAVQLVVGGVPASLVWHGDGTANSWDNTGAAQNWFNGINPDYFYDGDEVTFNDVGSNSPAINLASTLSPSSVTINAAQDYDLGGAGQITSPGSLTKNGNGTLILESPNSYGGGIFINAGTLQVGNAGTVGSLTGSISNNAALVVNRTDGIVLGSSISGSGSLTQAGTGSATLTASNSYVGPTTVSAGILYVQNNDALGSTAAGTTVANGAQLYIIGNTPNISPEPLSLAGATGSGALRKGGATTTAFGGAVTLTADTLVTIDSGAALNFTNASGIAGNNVNLSFSAAGNSLVAGSISLGSGSLAKAGAGTLSLSVSNNFSGGTTLTSGTLNITDNQALGSGLVSLAGTSANDLRLALNNGVAITNAVTFNSGKTYFSGAIYLLGSNSVASISGPITANGTPSNGGHFGTDTGGSGYLELLGPLNSTLGSGGTVTVRIGNVRFAGGGDAQGGLIRNDAGTASLGAGNGMPANAVLTLGANGAGIFDLNGYDQSLLSVVRWDTSGSHSGVVLNNNSLSPSTLTLNPPTGGSTSLAVFSSGGGLLNLSKQGAETLTLTARNTYTGNTVVGEGTLALGATGSISNSASILVAGNAILDVSAVTGGFSLAAGQTLKGNGTINGNTVINGTLAPGASIGTLTFNNNLTLGGVTSMELDKSLNTNDQVIVAGAVNYGGTLVVTNLAGTLTTNDTFTLFSLGVSASNFAHIVGSPGAGLTFSFTNGVLSVVAGINPNPTNLTATVSGTDLILSWPADHTGWTLQAQTNSLNIGLTTNWVDVPNSTAVNSVTNAIDAANGSVFYRLRYQP